MPMWGGDPVNYTDPTGQWLEGPWQCYHDLWYEYSGSKLIGIDNRGVQCQFIGDWSQIPPGPHGWGYDGGSGGGGGGPAGTPTAPAEEPQNDPPCAMSPRVARFYRDVREGAFERFQANGGDREIAYTIYRNNESGGLIAYFEVGTGVSGWGPWRSPGGVSPTIDRPGLTPLLVGHIHDAPAGSCGLFCFSPRGASDGDIGSKGYYPRGTQFVLHQKVFDEWEDSCF